MDDPIVKLAKLRYIADSADIEAQLATIQGCRPVLSILVKARAEAADALYALFEVSPEETNLIRGYQNIVHRYYDLLRWFKQLVREGLEADQEISLQEREEMIELLSASEEGREEAIELGLIERGTNAD